MALKFAFLVYDSRSGSTVLARYIAEHLKDVFVTTEIGFDNLFKLGERRVWGANSNDLDKVMYSGGQLRNFTVDRDRVKDILRRNARHFDIKKLFADLMCALLEEHDRLNATYVVIKNGSHAEYWRPIIKCLGADTKFIHIYRDPRAVVNSKLKTIRPYHKYESMAWGGGAIAAIRWRRRFRAMQDAVSSGASVLQVRYEDFITDPERVLEMLASELNSDLAKAQCGNTYEIPEFERGIHKRVGSSQLDAERLNAWQTELSNHDQRVIEVLVGRELEYAGYRRCHKLNLIQKFLVLLSAIPETIWLVFVHLLRTAATKSVNVHAP